jgi:uncharacterized protein YdeI (YjbR/CyaY-like superfamily)
MLSMGAELNLENGTPPTRRSGAGPTVEVPADLAAALDTHRGAEAAFDAMSYSNRRRIVLEIQTAKAEATRQRRIDNAVADFAPT